jgi:ATP-dependent Clp protease adaptor protein ClpS
MASDDPNEPTGGTSQDTDSIVEDELSEPPMYKVLLHNDHYTTMEFVVEVLEKVFRKARAEATRIMLNVHNEGVGLCGIYTAEIAETKIDIVHALARKAGFPLRCSLEEA